MDVRVKRAYSAVSKSDGQRILVDRLWPRGVSKDELHLADWDKDLAPSDELRKWFNHEPEKWEEFKRRYAHELDALPDAVATLRARVKQGPVTLIYAAKDEDHNNAIALQAYLEDRHRKAEQR